MEMYISFIHQSMHPCILFKKVLGYMCRKLISLEVTIFFPERPYTRDTVRHRGWLSVGLISRILQIR